MPPRKPFEANRGGWCRLSFPTPHPSGIRYRCGLPPPESPRWIAPQMSAKRGTELCVKKLSAFFFFSPLLSQSLYITSLLSVVYLHNASPQFYWTPELYILHNRCLTVAAKKQRNKKKNLLRKWRRDTALPMTDSRATTATHTTTKKREERNC